jgi:UDP-glucose 4-epimerase
MVHFERAAAGGGAMSNPSTPRALVTGAGGFLGFHLCQRLAGLGYEVTALTRSVGRSHQLSPAVRVRPCDLREPRAVTAVLREARPHWVFHMASHSDGPEDFDRMQACIENNLLGLSHLLRGLADLPEACLVYADSAKAYGDGPVPYRCEQRAQPLSSYAVSKTAGWQFIEVSRRIHGLRAAALRPTLIFGPHQSFNVFEFLFRAARDGRSEVELDGGVQTRDPLYVADATEAFIAAAKHIDRIDGMAVPIGGGCEITVQALAERVLQVLGSSARVVARPTRIRPTDTLRSWCDNSEALALMDWKPQHSLEEAIALCARAAQPDATPAL